MEMIDMVLQTLSVKQAADVFHVCPRTVRDWIAQGKIAGRKIGRSYIITMEEVIKAVEVTPAEEKPFDPQRKARLRLLKELCRGANVGTDTIWAMRQKELEMERQAGRR